MKRPNSVEEADALIEQQESIIGQIDVQIRERLRSFRREQESKDFTP